MNAQQEHKNIPATSGDLGRTSMKRAVIRVEPLSTYLENWKAPTSAVTRSGDTIYVSGFPPFDPDTGKVIKAPIERQTELVLKQMKLCLEMAGSSLAMCIARRSGNLRQSTRSTLDTFPRTRPLESLSAFPHGAAPKDRRTHRRHLGESATERIYLGQDLQRQSGARSEDQRVPSCGRGRRSQAWSQRCEDGSARGRIAVCVEAGSTAITAGSILLRQGKNKIGTSSFSLKRFEDLSH